MTAVPIIPAADMAANCFLGGGGTPPLVISLFSLLFIISKGRRLLVGGGGKKRKGGETYDGYDHAVVVHGDFPHDGGADVDAEGDHDDG